MLRSVLSALVVLAVMTSAAHGTPLWFQQPTYRAQIYALQRYDDDNLTATDDPLATEPVLPLDALPPYQATKVPLDVPWSYRSYRSRTDTANELRAEIDKALGVEVPPPPVDTVGFTDVLKNVVSLRRIQATASPYLIAGDDDVVPVVEEPLVPVSNKLGNVLRQSAQQLEALAEDYEVDRDLNMASQARRLAHQLRQEARDITGERVVPALLPARRWAFGLPSPCSA